MTSPLPDRLDEFDRCPDCGAALRLTGASGGFLACPGDHVFARRVPCTHPDCPARAKYFHQGVGFCPTHDHPVWIDTLGRVRPGRAPTRKKERAERSVITLPGKRA
jgi:hypothetical protein